MRTRSYPAHSAVWHLRRDVPVWADCPDALSRVSTMVCPAVRTTAKEPFTSAQISDTGSAG